MPYGLMKMYLSKRKEVPWDCLEPFLRNALRPDEDVFIQKKGSPAGIAFSHSCGMPHGLMKMYLSKRKEVPLGLPSAIPAECLTA
ncbi:MAG: hypothetical protein IPN29_15885 [Saprospiraceae bacterium]|nr:hypothetical protein [Saprospiraceae bacterium]